MSSEELRKALANLWTTQDLVRMFDVTPMTVYLWRVNRGLPYLPLPGAARGAVRFVPAEVRAWARENDVRMIERTRRSVLKRAA